MKPLKKLASLHSSVIAVFRGGQVIEKQTEVCFGWPWLLFHTGTFILKAIILINECTCLNCDK